HAIRAGQQVGDGVDSVRPRVSFPAHARIFIRHGDPGIGNSGACWIAHGAGDGAEGALTVYLSDKTHERNGQDDSLCGSQKAVSAGCSGEPNASAVHRSDSSSTSLPLTSVR